MQEYLVGFRYTTAVMKRAAHLDRIAYEFGIDSFEVTLCRMTRMPFAFEMWAVCFYSQ